LKVELPAAGSRLIRGGQVVAPLLILALAFALRVHGYNFDDGQLLQPDESSIDQTAQSLGCCLGNPQTTPPTWPNPLSHFFMAAHAPYNPYTFNYGSLPYYLLAGLSRAAQALGRTIPFLRGWQAAGDLVHINWIGRWLSASFDTASLFLLYRLAVRIFERAVALLTMSLGALTVLDIQLAHFYAVDTLLTFFVLATLLAAIEVATTNSLRSYILMGAGFGAALATKSSAFPLLIPMLGAAALSLSRSTSSSGLNRPAGLTSEASFAARIRSRLSVAATPQRVQDPFSSRLNLALTGLLSAMLAALLVFAVCEPYGIIDHSLLVANVKQQNAIIVSHTLPLPYTLQFAGTTPYWYDLKNLVMWYMGPALGLTACFGLFWSAYKVLTRRAHASQLVLFLWVIPYFLIVGAFWAKPARYLLPVIPLLTLFASALLVESIRGFRGRLRLLPVAVALVVVLCTAGWAVAFEHIYSTTNDQVAASTWIYRHLRPGTPFATEGAWDRNLPLCLPQPGGCPSGYGSYQLNLYDPDGKAKLERLVHALTHDRFIVMSSERFVDSIPRNAPLFPLTARYYQLLLAGRLVVTRKVAELELLRLAESLGL